MTDPHREAQRTGWPAGVVNRESSARPRSILSRRVNFWVDTRSFFSVCLACLRRSCFARLLRCNEL